MTTTSAYIATVNETRTIEVPEGIPVGARVAVVVLPPEAASDDHALRAVRFQRVMDAIRAAIRSNFTPPAISDRELQQLIDEARRAAKA